jgi:hypothetical protein
MKSLPDVSAADAISSKAATDIFRDTLSHVLKYVQGRTEQNFVIGAVSVPEKYNGAARSAVMDALADVLYMYNHTVILARIEEPLFPELGAQERAINLLFDKKVEKGQVRIWSAVKGHEEYVVLGPMKWFNPKVLAL